IEQRPTVFVVHAIILKHYAEDLAKRNPSVCSIPDGKLRPIESLGCIQVHQIHPET
ncbi:hypothetical protein AVEN_260278-1, partial [Araneus ventricosus]